MDLKRLLRGAGIALASAAGLAATAASAQTSLSVCYINHPVQNASVAMLEKLAKKQGITLVKTLTSYTVYLPKITQMLTAGAADQCDIIWNNDDWGQDLAQYLIPMDDVSDITSVAEGTLIPFYDTNKKTTAVPIATTAGILFYRKDLIPEDQVPKTWDELVSVSQRLQKEGKVRWGYVGGMSYQNTFFSLWWTLWNNECDVYFPLYERDNEVLKKTGWKPMMDQACQLQTAEFWWDALNKNKISPPGMTTYSRDEANAIFQAGEAAFTVADTTFLGQFNSPQKSKVAGKIDMARYPVGPMSKGSRTWIDLWGWSVPKSIPADRQKAAKALLGAMMTDTEGQIEQWKETGGPPPSTKVWDILRKDDPVFQHLDKVLISGEHVRSAYYFRNWAAVHKVYSDTLIRALKGPREDIAKTLAAGVQPMHDGGEK